MLARGTEDKEYAMSPKLNSAIAAIGIDIGKNSFHLVGQDRRGALVLRQKWSRGQIEARLANMPPCLIGMEACVGAHHLSRKLQALGHDARLMPAKYVRPYSKGKKNDYRDAEAIAEAVQRPTMKFVATKTADQLDLQALHRVRARLVSQRTGIINQIRAQVALADQEPLVPGAPRASRDLLASPWAQARPHLGIMQPEVLLKPAGRPHLGQPGQPQTLRVALEIFHSAESGRQDRY